MPQRRFEAFLDRADIRAELDPIARALARRSTAVRRANDAIDERPIWTLAFGGVQQGPEFGTDSWKASLRGVWHGSGFDHTVNGDWSRVDVITGERPTIAKFGYEATGLFLQRTALTENGVTVGISGALERYSNVPAAVHDFVSKAALKVEVPTSGEAKVQITIMYANHPDLLTNLKGWTGHLGFAWDLSALRQP
jgi:hypothetical protein